MIAYKSNSLCSLTIAVVLGLSLSPMSHSLVLAASEDQLPPLCAPSSTLCAPNAATDTPQTQTSPAPTPALPPESPVIIYTDLFPDLKVGNQYFIGVKYLKDLGLIQGYPDGTFAPLREVNRAEALKILTGAIPFQSMSDAEKPLTHEQEASGDITANPACHFSDVDTEAWYYSYVCKAFMNKVISGYPDGTFQPAQTINRAESLKMDILQAGLSTQTDSAENFDDVLTTDWFNDYARLANQKTFMIESRDGNLTPARKMNRGDFVMLIYRTIRSIRNHSEFGNATYYGGRFDGQTTASGETFRTDELPTAAHKTLPFGTIAKVTNLSNGKTVTVRINDRGPYVNGAIIDLSTAAFQQIASLSTGVVATEVEIISKP